MNNKGDFFIGNQKKSSSTGEEITFDTPISTVTGEDPSRLSVVFDEVIIKERLVVEGGDSGQVLSQFDGPVTFNGEIKSTNKVRITNESNSTSPTSGALTISGGVGIASDLNVGGDLNVSNDLDVVGAVQLASGGGITTTGGDFYVGGDFSLSGQIIGNGNFDAGTGGFIGAGGTFGNIQIAISDDNTIDTVSGDLTLNSANGTVVVSGNLDVNGTGTHTFAGDVEVDGEGRFIGDLIAFFSSDERLKDNIEVIEDPLSKVLSISGNTFDWNSNSNKEGRDTGVIAQEVESLGLPGIVTTRDDGYKAVRYEKLVPLLIEAIKELGNKLENLEQKLKVTNSWREFR